MAVRPHRLVEGRPAAPGLGVDEVLLLFEHRSHGDPVEVLRLSAAKIDSGPVQEYQCKP